MEAKKAKQDHKNFRTTHNKICSIRKSKQLFRNDICFTKREIRCLMLISKGKTVGEIVKILNISRSTVRDHLKNIRHKTGCSSNPEVISFIHNGKFTRRGKFISKKNITFS